MEILHFTMLVWKTMLMWLNSCGENSGIYFSNSTVDFTPFHESPIVSEIDTKYFLTEINYEIHCEHKKKSLLKMPFIFFKESLQSV